MLKRTYGRIRKAQDLIDEARSLLIASAKELKELGCDIYDEQTRQACNAIESDLGEAVAGIEQALEDHTDEEESR